MKTIRTIYTEQTGNYAEASASNDDHGLALYIEAPTAKYIQWLEECAAKSIGTPAEQTDNSPMDAMQRRRDVEKVIDCVCKHGGLVDGADMIDTLRSLFPDLYVAAQHQ